MKDAIIVVSSLRKRGEVLTSLQSPRGLAVVAISSRRGSQYPGCMIIVKLHCDRTLSEVSGIRRMSWSKSEVAYHGCLEDNISRHDQDGIRQPK